MRMASAHPLLATATTLRPVEVLSDIELMLKHGNRPCGKNATAGTGDEEFLVTSAGRFVKQKRLKNECLSGNSTSSRLVTAKCAFRIIKTPHPTSQDRSQFITMCRRPSVFGGNAFTLCSPECPRRLPERGRK